MWRSNSKCFKIPNDKLQIIDYLEKNDGFEKITRVLNACSKSDWRTTKFAFWSFLHFSVRLDILRYFVVQISMWVSKYLCKKKIYCSAGLISYSLKISTKLAEPGAFVLYSIVHIALPLCLVEGAIKKFRSLKPTLFYGKSINKYFCLKFWNALIQRISPCMTCIWFLLYDLGIKCEEMLVLYSK